MEEKELKKMAKEYSFTIPSDLYHLLDEEQRKIWNEECERDFINGFREGQKYANKLKCYRIKHVLTNLYYQPGSGNNLSTTGKVYSHSSSELTNKGGQDYLTIRLNSNSEILKTYQDIFSKPYAVEANGVKIYHIPKSEFIIEKY